MSDGVLILRIAAGQHANVNKRLIYKSVASKGTTVDIFAAGKSLNSDGTDKGHS